MRASPAHLNSVGRNVDTGLVEDDDNDPNYEPTRACYDKARKRKKPANKTVQSGVHVAASPFLIATGHFFAPSHLNE